MNNADNESLSIFMDFLKHNFSNENEIYISHGWIDSHIHLSSISSYKLSENNFKTLNGVTAYIDAGSSGSENIDEVIKLGKEIYGSKIFYWLNISPRGLVTINELEDYKIDLELLNTKLNIKEVVGIKVRYSTQSFGNNDNYEELLTIASKIKANIMYHVGNEPPMFKSLTKIIKKNDVITHTYNGKNNNVINYLKNNKDNLPRLDIGYGNSSFSLNSFRTINDMNILPDSISTDLHDNVFNDNPTCRLNIIMSLFLTNKTSLNKIIKMVTINPFKYYIGENRYPSYKKTFTAFKIVKSQEQIIDSYGNKEKIIEKIVPIAIYVDERSTKYE